MASIRSHAFAILLGAAIFAVLGFYMLSWDHQYLRELGPDGEKQIVPMVVLLKWTLQGGGIVFALTGLITLTGMRVGPLLYGTVGALATAALLTVTIWEMTNTARLYSGAGPLILIVLAAYTGYTSVTALYDALRQRPTSTTAEPSA